MHVNIKGKIDSFYPIVITRRQDSYSDGLQDEDASPTSA